MLWGMSTGGPRGNGGIICAKLLNEEMGERASVVERFRKEAKIMTALDHPHIAKVDASGRGIVIGYGEPEAWCLRRRGGGYDPR